MKLDTRQHCKIKIFEDFFAHFSIFNKQLRSPMPNIFCHELDPHLVTAILQISQIFHRKKS